MQGTYYETDRVFTLLVLLVFAVILYASYRRDVKRAQSKRSSRAKSQLKNRKERYWVK